MSQNTPGLPAAQVGRLRLNLRMYFLEHVEEPRPTNLALRLATDISEILKPYLFYFSSFSALLHTPSRHTLHDTLFLTWVY